MTTIENIYGNIPDQVGNPWPRTVIILAEHTILLVRSGLEGGGGGGSGCSVSVGVEDEGLLEDTRDTDEPVEVSYKYFNKLLSKWSSSSSSSTQS